MNFASRKAVQAATKTNVWLYRRTNGRIGGRGMDKRPLLLLTVPGRRSGTLHTVPVVYFDHSSGYLVVGTGMGGSKRTPQWFLNLQAAGRARIRTREREHEADAHVAGDAERAQLWGQIATEAPSFAKFEVRTGRTFPIAVLTTRPMTD
jgi:deazaflavin-dependent oxidoreductase (nitroreductase family)